MLSFKSYLQTPLCLKLIFSANGVIWRQRAGTFSDLYLPKPTRAARQWTSGLAPPSRSSRSENRLKGVGLTMLSQVLAYILTFCVVLICGVVTKGTTLFMTSQIKPDRSSSTSVWSSQIPNLYLGHILMYES